MFDVDGWLRSTEEEKEAGQGRACCRNWVTSLFDVCQAFRLCHSGQFRPPFRGSLSLAVVFSKLRPPGRKCRVRKEEKMGSQIGWHETRIALYLPCHE